MLVLFTALTGLVYPLAITGVAQLVFHAKANGSLVYVDGKLVGSSLIGQNFAVRPLLPSPPLGDADPDPRPRDPTKTIDAPYNAANSIGLQSWPDLAKADRPCERRHEGESRAGWSGPVAADAVTTSASGLDPTSRRTCADPGSGGRQGARLERDAVRALVQSHIEERFAGIFGEPRVNVLRLNMELNELRTAVVSEKR